MIVRIWHGRTPRGVADEYAAFLARRALADCRAVHGNLAAVVCRRDEGNVTHFLIVSRWVNEEAIRAFAGDEPLKPRYHPEDTGYLLEFEPEVQHFTVVGRAP
ncbi:MAG TPA: antibiotic biosynthesis monooxygenase [Steroidobacteraceae bacterium]|nr:antibiotic biosynthesis monooxygenase [Steroidobacteraceae bacterium]